MAEYIERNAAKNAIYAAVRKHNEYDFCERKIISGLAEADDAIDAVPAADVQPVPEQGRWIWDDEGYHCSECFYHAYGETAEVLSGNWHYCPNCEAKVDGGET